MRERITLQRNMLLGLVSPYYHFKWLTCYDPSIQLDFPGRAFLHSQHPVGFVVIRKPFPLRIPFQRPVKSLNDPPKQQRAGRAVSRFDIADRSFACLHTLEKITGMTTACVEVYVVRTDRFFQDARRIGNDVFTVHADFPFRADEPPAARFADFLSLVRPSIDDGSIGVFVDGASCFNIEFHRPGAVRVQAPLHDVVMVLSPIDSAVSEQVGVGVVSIGNRRRGSKPQVPIETIRDRFSLTLILVPDRPASRTVGVDFFQFPYSSASDQFTGQAEFPVILRTLLSACLENPVILLNRFDHRLAFVPAVGFSQ